MAKISTTTALVITPNNVGFGEILNFAVTVMGATSGTVQLLEGTALLQTLTLVDGAASWDSSDFVAGLHNITAQFVGDDTYATSSGVAAFYMQPAIVESILPGFALIAEYQANGDEVQVPTAVLSAFPPNAKAGDPITLFWETSNVGQIRITSATGFDTGFVGTTGTGLWTVNEGFQFTTTLTLVAYDTEGNVIMVNGVGLKAVAVVTIQ